MLEFVVQLDKFKVRKFMQILMFIKVFISVILTVSWWSHLI